jgi:hypothetical protein
MRGLLIFARGIPFWLAGPTSHSAFLSGSFRPIRQMPSCWEHDRSENEEVFSDQCARIQVLPPRGECWTETWKLSLGIDEVACCGKSDDRGTKPTYSSPVGNIEPQLPDHGKSAAALCQDQCPSWGKFYRYAVVSDPLARRL